MRSGTKTQDCFSHDGGVATAAAPAPLGCISFSPQPQHKYTEIPTGPAACCAQQANSTMCALTCGGNFHRTRPLNLVTASLCTLNHNKFTCFETNSGTTTYFLCTWKYFCGAFVFSWQPTDGSKVGHRKEDY